MVRIHDHALPDALHRRLRRAVEALGRRGLAATYRTTFWFPLGAPPAALPELALVALRPLLPLRGVAGVEWWLSRMATTDVGVDFHRDRDEARFARTGVEVHPASTAVLYLGRARGGLLAVTSAPPCDANPARAPDDLGRELDLVRPWPNRLALFPGDATHGVLDARGRVPAGRLPAIPGARLRLALVLNLWRRRPEAVPRYADAPRYPALALPPAGARVRGGGRSRRPRSA